MTTKGRYDARTKREVVTDRGKRTITLESEKKSGGVPPGGTNQTSLCSSCNAYYFQVFCVHNASNGRLSFRHNYSSRVSSSAKCRGQSKPSREKTLMDPAMPTFPSSITPTSEVSSTHPQLAGGVIGQGKKVDVTLPGGGRYQLFSLRSWRISSTPL